jgi:hypothetical protein
MLDHPPVILRRRAVVPGHGQQVETPAIAASMGRALEAAEEIAVKQGWRKHLSLY